MPPLQETYCAYFFIDLMNAQFAHDVIAGLSARPKRLSSKYFYDDEGSRLFQEIMGLEEYYLTSAEFEILTTHKARILEYSGVNKPFELIEFGAGDGLKTKILLRYFLEQQAQCVYEPIDISEAALNGLAATLLREIPAINVRPMHGEYFEALRRLNAASQTKKVILFLGSNVGNFTHDETLAFLAEVRQNMRSGDVLIIGFDLKKDPQIILRAYNDAGGVTAQFNRNLLRRINTELDADFDLNTFIHAPVYDPALGEARSYLVSTKQQMVSIADASFTFEAWEAIHTEISRKYSIPYIEDLARLVGFSVCEHLFDVNRYFVDSVWAVK